MCYAVVNHGSFEGGFSVPARAQISLPAPRGSSAQLRPSVLAREPIVRILRDDRVATLEMDYNAHDTQRIKEMYYELDNSDVMGRKAIMGALSLYLDFINMFMFMLHFFGGSNE
jgi:hypothetical protein